MPIVRVYGINKLGPKLCEELQKCIAKSVASVKKLDLVADDVSVCLVAGHDPTEVSRDVIIEISSLLKKRKRTKKVRDQLARVVAKEVFEYLTSIGLSHGRLFKCFVQSFAQCQGFAKIDHTKPRNS
jgi:hypothetical protein